MSEIINLDESKSFIVEENRIEPLYNQVMQDFDINRFEMTFDTKEVGSNHILYAKGYENMGVGDIVAQLK